MPYTRAIFIFQFMLTKKLEKNRKKVELPIPGQYFISYFPTFLCACGGCIIMIIIFACPVDLVI